ncbi:YifB family Mg chelatase-like AAA ATPase [Micavibrio aeruginosavorus]|uniref:YifB family Mg chelatase-like AAA ATPase n=1 Tax=Micavibrio aeruginosavorus TaxID=349221 RepID=UPI003F4AEA21
MVARVQTVAFHGVDVCPVDVQVQIASGLPSFTIVGLPDKAVGESRERVRAALHALGLSLPPKKLTVNLAPADLAKEGSHYDLPIALGVLAAMDVLPRDELANALVLGELSLDGGIRSVAGVLPAALHAGSNDNRLICPAACGGEAAWAGEHLDILAPGDLLQLINHMKGTQVLTRPTARIAAANDGGRFMGPDLSQVRGQETARRALEITAAGGHNLLMSGPPGSGKSLLAACLAGILPPLTPREALEISMIHSLAGTLPDGGLVQTRPFRDPHHSASLPALVGGGAKARPGEISLAHNGVLFLDELPEFARQTLESLRQPLETGQAVVARANHHVTYPARVQVVAALNPCRCGYLGDPSRECTKAPRCGGDYQAKMSGPLLDRFDLRIDMPAVALSDLQGNQPGGEDTKTVAARVLRARQVQAARYEGRADISPTGLNAHVSGAKLEDIVALDDAARAMALNAAEAMKLSARGWHRLLRVARTIADLDGAGDRGVATGHVAEALSYRHMGHITSA